MAWFECIGSASGGGGSSGINYSTTEQQIGTWIDGSTLYQTTVHISSLRRDGSDVYVNHGISGVNKILGYESFFSNNNGRCCDKNTDTNTTYVCSVFEANRTQIAYAIGSGWDFTDAYVTLRYTKT